MNEKEGRHPARGRKRGMMVATGVTICLLVAVGMAVLLAPRTRLPEAAVPQVAVEARALTHQETAEVVAVVRKQTSDPIRHIGPDRGGTVRVFVSEGCGRCEFSLWKVDGQWRIVGERYFYRAL